MGIQICLDYWANNDVSWSITLQMTFTKMQACMGIAAWGYFYMMVEIKTRSLFSAIAWWEVYCSVLKHWDMREHWFLYGSMGGTPTVASEWRRTLIIASAMACPRIVGVLCLLGAREMSRLVQTCRCLYNWCIHTSRFVLLWQVEFKPYFGGTKEQER